MQKVNLPNEEQVLRKAVRGDEEAFTQLYDAHIDGVFRFVLLRVTDKSTAEDITSTVFMKAWENLGDYKIGKAPFRAWIYRIARNAIIDHYRTRKESVSLDAVFDLADEHGPNPTEHVAIKLEMEEIASHLLKLTEDQRNVLILRFVNGFSTKETAKALGKRQGAIRALQMRALQALAALLEQ